MQPIRPFLRLLPLSAVLVGLNACGPTCDAIDGRTVVLTEDNNYQFDGALEIEPVPVAAQDPDCVDGTADISACLDYTIRWSDLTTDLQLAELDPTADIDRIALTNFRYLSHDEVELGLSHNTLLQADVGLYVDAETDGGAEITLSSLSLFGNDIDVERYLSADFGSFLLSLQTGDVTGVGTRMAVFIEPTTDSTNTLVTYSNTSTILDFEVDLLSLIPTPMFVGGTAEVDWSGIETSGLGQPFEPGDVDQILVAWYERATLADLQGDFLALEREASRLWTADLLGDDHFDLADLEGDEAFDGVNNDGTWLLALRCATCPNPAPLFLTELVACDD